MLTNETITFGKYRNKDVKVLLRDRNYCKWLLKQDWMKERYEYIWNIINSYNPKKYFVKDIEKDNISVFYKDYPFFHLTPPEELEIFLSDDEKKCYAYYREVINSLFYQIQILMEKGEPNIYNIKAPVNWLKKFEQEYDLTREDFKLFLYTYDLPNIPYIIEDIKKAGGIEYKGAKSFKIAKQNSLNQEEWWGDILKEKYKEKLGTQFQYNNCIFDFIHIDNNIIYECKLGLKDFNKEQYQKYLTTLGKYNIIYLISKDCVIDINRKKIFTSNLEKYLIRKVYVDFDKIIKDFEISYIEDIKNIV